MSIIVVLGKLTGFICLSIGLGMLAAKLTNQDGSND